MIVSKGYQKERPNDYKDHMRVMKKAVKALQAVYGTQYTYGPISEVESDMSKAEVKPIIL